MNKRAHPMNKRASSSNIRINENPQIRSENAHFMDDGTSKTSYLMRRMKDIQT